jgi:hypothetical protein
MLVQLGTRPAPEDGPRSSLLACHARIRGTLSLAVSLCDATEAPPARVVDAATRIHRYFREALPLHHQDEELALRPLLLAHHPHLAAALDLMDQQHHTLDALLEPLMPRWQALAAQPATLSVEGRSLYAHVVALQAAFEDHLHHEEETLFTVLPQLPASAQAQLLDAIRARRSG